MLWLLVEKFISTDVVFDCKSTMGWCFRYLYICVCARSGFFALGKLDNKHDRLGRFGCFFPPAPRGHPGLKLQRSEMVVRDLVLTIFHPALLVNGVECPRQIPTGCSTLLPYFEAPVVPKCMQISHWDPDWRITPLLPIISIHLRFCDFIVVLPSSDAIVNKLQF